MSDIVAQTSAKTTPKIIQRPCLRIQQGKHVLYSFILDAKKLYKLVEINRKELNKDEGYQRALSESRRKAIASYIDSGNAIPNALLIAFDDDAVQYSPTKNELTIPDKKNIGWVIDGQHRLAGAAFAKENIDLFVIAFLGLDITEQVRQFVVVNREAKGVPTSLYIDLLKQLPPSVSEGELAKDRAADINKLLRNDPSSVFYGRIVYSAPQKGQMSLTNFVRKVGPLIHGSKGKFNLYTLEEQKGILQNYFKALENIFPAEFSEKKMRFFSTLGFGAAMNALPTIFDLAYKHYGGFRVEDVSKVLKTIDDFDFSAWEQQGTGSAAEIQAGSDFTELIKYRMEQHGKAGSLRL